MKLIFYICIALLTFLIGISAEFFNHSDKAGIDSVNLSNQKTGECWSYGPAESAPVTNITPLSKNPRRTHRK